MDRRNARKTRRGSRPGKVGARRSSARISSRDAPPPAPDDAEASEGQGNLWQVGLAALSRGGKLAASAGGATRITESLQGGLKKLEEVFDQRVLDSLARASMPSPEELRQLIDRVAELDARLTRLTRRPGKR